MEKRIRNLEVRQALNRKSLHLYDLATLLGVSEASITRMMRTELPQDEQSRIIKLIEKEAHKIC